MGGGFSLIELIAMMMLGDSRGGDGARDHLPPADTRRSAMVAKQLWRDLTFVCQ